MGRAERLCSSVDEKDRERRHITSALESNGYPQQMIRRYGQGLRTPMDSKNKSAERGDEPKDTLCQACV